jgi:hypothetical protein
MFLLFYWILYFILLVESDSRFDTELSFVERAVEEVKSDYLHGAQRPSPQEQQVIEVRQVGYKVKNLFAVESEKCMHGFPRAFVVCFPFHG